MLYHIIRSFEDPEEKASWKHCGYRRKCIFSISHNVFFLALYGIRALKIGFLNRVNSVISFLLWETTLSDSTGETISM